MNVDYLSRRAAAYRCVAMLIAVVAGGTAGFVYTESDWSVWKSLYFTLITITTVGYGDEGVSDAGEIVATLLLVCGIGIFTYSISTLVQLAMDRDTAKARKMIKQVKSWKDHILVCGYGRMGETICRQLIDAGKQCAVIEEDDSRYQAALADGFVAIQGAAIEDEMLQLGGIEQAAAVVAAVNSDSDNMYIVVSARALNEKCAIIARAETESSGRKMEHAGASFAVLPHMMAGESVANAILNPRLAYAMRSNTSSANRITLREAKVSQHSELINCSIEEVGRQLGDLVFVAVESAEGEFIMRPSGKRVFEAGDVVFCAGRQEDIQTVCNAALPEVLAV